LPDRHDFGANDARSARFGLIRLDSCLAGTKANVKGLSGRHPARNHVWQAWICRQRRLQGAIEHDSDANHVW